MVSRNTQLIKRRGKSGLLSIGKGWQETADWITARRNKEVKVVNAQRATA
jgi:succinyl-CoA synthetase beta subunit